MANCTVRLMPRYLALFGSINVGKNRIAMADLRHALAREEIDNVETVIASGNVLFDFEERPSTGLEDLFAYVLRERFDMDSFVAIRSRAELVQAISGNPFAADGNPAQVHTLFLAEQPGQAQFDKLVADYSGRGPERLALGTRAVHIDFCEGVGRSRLTGPFLERRLGRGTARNLNSLQRMLDKMPR